MTVPFTRTEKGEGGMKICPDCQRTHASDDVRAVHRFDPDHPTTFAHRLLPGVLFPTREAAQDAGCAERQRLTPTDPMGTGDLLEAL